MKKFSWLLLYVFASISLLSSGCADEAADGCESDADCRFGRVCNDAGFCVGEPTNGETPTNNANNPVNNANNPVNNANNPVNNGVGDPCTEIDDCPGALFCVGSDFTPRTCQVARCNVLSEPIDSCFLVAECAVATGLFVECSVDDEDEAVCACASESAMAEFRAELEDGLGACFSELQRLGLFYCGGPVDN